MECRAKYKKQNCKTPIRYDKNLNNLEFGNDFRYNTTGRIHERKELSWTSLKTSALQRTLSKQ